MAMFDIYWLIMQSVYTYYVGVVQPDQILMGHFETTDLVLGYGDSASVTNVALVSKNDSNVSRYAPLDGSIHESIGQVVEANAMKRQAEVQKAGKWWTRWFQLVKGRTGGEF